MYYLVDTMAFVWYLRGRQRRQARKILREADRGHHTIAISGVTLMEILYLSERRRIVKVAVAQMHGPEPPLSWREIVEGIHEEEVAKTQAQAFERSMALSAVINLLVLLDPGASLANAGICQVEGRNIKFSLANRFARMGLALQLIEAEKLTADEVPPNLRESRPLLLGSVQNDLDRFQKARMNPLLKEEAEKCIAVIVDQAEKMIGVTPAQLNTVAPTITVTPELHRWAELNCYCNPTFR
jgi:predicted nucleic acid-binding protein